MKFIHIYLLLGAMLNLVGPLASQTRREMRELRSKTVPLEFVVSRKRKLLITEIIFRLLVMLLYPVAYALWFIDIFLDRKEKKDMKLRQEKVKDAINRDYDKVKQDIIQNRSFIYFRDAPGGGTIRCHGCGFSEEIVSFSHGYEERHPFTRGYQCQKCGRFHGIQVLGSKMITPYLKCCCGGELSNAKPIFCPKCKACDVFFAREYVT